MGLLRPWEIRENSSKHFAKVSSDVAICFGRHAPSPCMAVNTGIVNLRLSIKTGSPQAVTCPMTSQFSCHAPSSPLHSEAPSDVTEYPNCACSISSKGSKAIPPQPKLTSVGNALRITWYGDG